MYKKLKDAVTGKETPFTTTLSYTWRSRNLIFNFKCANSKCFSAYSEDNDPIYLGDVVELFLCTGKDPNEYYEIEVAPNGTRFFALIKNKGEKLDTTFFAPPFTADVRMTEGGYDVTITIPESSIGYTGKEKIRFNAYRIETEGGTPEKNLLALNPTGKRAFHVPERFVTLDID